MSHSAVYFLWDFYLMFGWTFDEYFYLLKEDTKGHLECVSHKALYCFYQFMSISCTHMYKYINPNTWFAVIPFICQVQFVLYRNILLISRY